MSAETPAERALKGLCDASYSGPALVVTDSEILRRIPKRRAVTRENEERRLSDGVNKIRSYLQQGATVTSANEIAESNGFPDSIRVTQGYVQLVEAVAERFNAGDNVSTDTGGTDGVIVLRLWHDPTHGPVS